jgi:hypothetical protein
MHNLRYMSFTLIKLDNSFLSLSLSQPKEMSPFLFSQPRGLLSFYSSNQKIYHTFCTRKQIKYFPSPIQSIELFFATILIHNTV